MKWIKKCFILLFILALLPLEVSAAGAVDLTQGTSLTVYAKFDEKILQGMQLHAYLVSEMDDCGELTVTERFRAYEEALDIRGKNDAAWQEMAETLEREISLDKTIEPDASVAADESGVARFTGLTHGLYLIVADGVELDGYVYTNGPFFAVLPEQDLKENVWNYDVTAHAKPEQSPVRKDYSVVKVWKDDCHKSQRPTSIQIRLMCDGEVYDTITLPEDGKWQHTWKDLDVNHKWTVTEEKQSGYAKPEITKDGTTFTVTNTCNKSGKTGGGSLPQTGQLWWPVPMLISVGLLFIIAGVIRRRGIRNEK